MKSDLHDGAVLGLSALLAFAVGASLAFFILLAHADRLDTIQSMEPKDYCEVIADQFYAGVIGKLYGSAREFKAATPAIIEDLEHGIPLPKDAMYVIKWDELSDRDKDFVREHVLLGYDEAAKINRELSDEETRAMGQAYYDRCMFDKRTDASFMRVEALENVNPAKLLAQCDEWLSDYKRVARDAKHGRCDAMKELNRDVEGVEDTRREKITRLVNEACASTDIDEWFNGYARQCMVAK